MFDLIIGAIVLLFALVAIYAMVRSMYVQAPPNKALIISGFRAKPRTLIGTGGFVIPFLERVDELYLGQITVPIVTGSPVPTRDFINIRVDAVAKIMVGNSEESIAIASKNFLNMSESDIVESLKESLEGNMREIIGTLSLEVVNTDRDSFSEQVVSKASVDMQKLGIEIISCNIQNVTDEQGLIVALGADNEAKIRKNASISKAVATKDVAIQEAKARKEANDAQVEADLEIAKKQNELAIRKAELKLDADMKQAEADSAYDIQRQEQEKVIQAKAVETQIAKAEKDAELRAKQVEIAAKELEASINKKAEAEKYATQRTAEADLEKRKREAEAQLYEEQQKAEACKAEAEAKRFAIEQEALAIKAKGEAEATAIKLKGQAEAEAIQAKGIAEAEAMDKKAEAFSKYNKAALAEMAIKVLPQVAEAVAKPLSSIDKVTLYGNGGMEDLSQNVPMLMAKTFDTIKDATGIDLKNIAEADTFEAKTTKNVNLTGLPEKINVTMPQPKFNKNKENNKVKEDK